VELGVQRASEPDDEFPVDVVLKLDRVLGKGGRLAAGRRVGRCHLDRPLVPVPGHHQVGSVADGGDVEAGALEGGEQVQLRDAGVEPRGLELLDEIGVAGAHSGEDLAQRRTRGRKAAVARYGLEAGA
jgi:hypothetical protein